MSQRLVLNGKEVTQSPELPGTVSTGFGADSPLQWRGPLCGTALADHAPSVPPASVCASSRVNQCRPIKCRTVDSTVSDHVRLRFHTPHAEFHVILTALASDQFACVRLHDVIMVRDAELERLGESHRCAARKRKCKA